MACLFGLSIQLSFASSRAPLPSCNSNVGSASLSGSESDGPMARTITFCDDCPTTIVPAIKTLSPVWTKPRVEMFASFELADVSRS